MTLGKLIRKSKAHPPDTEVWMEVDARIACIRRGMMASKVYVLTHADRWGVDQHIVGVYSDLEGAKRAYEAREPAGISGEWMGTVEECHRCSRDKDGGIWATGYIEEHEVNDGE